VDLIALIYIQERAVFRCNIISFSLQCKQRFSQAVQHMPAKAILLALEVDRNVQEVPRTANPSPPPSNVKFEDIKLQLDTLQKLGVIQALPASYFSHPHLTK